MWLSKVAPWTVKGLDCLGPLILGFFSIPIPLLRRSVFPTLCDPVNCSQPDSSVCGIFQAKKLEWVAISLSRGSSHPKDRTHISCVSCIVGGFFTHWATWEAPSISILLGLWSVVGWISGSGNCKYTGSTIRLGHRQIFISGWILELNPPGYRGPTVYSFREHNELLWEKKIFLKYEVWYSLGLVSHVKFPCWSGWKTSFHKIVNQFSPVARRKSHNAQEEARKEQEHAF